MAKAMQEETVEIPKKEYDFLKELFLTVKRQEFLLRIAEAEENFKTGNVNKTSVSDFIDSI